MAKKYSNWEKIEVIGKILLGVFGIIVTLFIQFDQKKLSEQIAETNKIQLISSLINPFIKGDLNQRVIMVELIKKTDSTVYSIICNALVESGEIDPLLRRLIFKSKEKIENKTITLVDHREENRIITKLMSLNKTVELLIELEKLVEVGKIAVGNQSDFDVSEKARLYVIIVDERNVYGMYQLYNNVYQDIKTTEKLQSLEKYKGNRAVFIQIF